jgi:hypothetical protein
MSFLYAAFGPTSPSLYTMNSTKGLTPSEKKEYAELRLIPSYEARKRLAELQGKIVAASQQKAKAGILKPRKAMRKVSAKRAKINAEYTKLRKAFLRDFPQCETMGCAAPATQVHHKKRRGQYMLDVRSWMAVCAEHHHEIETNGKWAREMGYIIDTFKNAK